MLETQAAPDDRPDPDDRAAEPPPPWNREPAEDRDGWWYVPAGVVGEW